MDIQTAIQKIETTIAIAKECGCSRAHICFYHNEIQALPIHHTNLGHPIFFVLHDGHIREGLTSEEWTQVCGQIHRFIERGMR